MSSVEPDRYYLLEQFREFYATCLRFKMEIEQSDKPKAKASDSADPVILAPDPSDSIDIEVDDESAQDKNALGGADRHAKRIQDELLALTQQNAQAVLRRGDEREQRRFREIQYVCAALADEVFLGIDWPGTDYWSGHLIEQILFHTHDAGTRFFANLEELLRLRDPTRADVAATYLLALSVGFRGKYQDIESQARLENYRHQLFALLFQRNPGLAEDAQLFPQAYAHTLTGKQVEWLPVLRPWILALGGVLGLYLILSHVVWMQGAGDISTIAERVTAQLSPGKSTGPRRKPTTQPAGRGAEQKPAAPAPAPPPPPASPPKAEAPAPKATSTESAEATTPPPIERRVAARNNPSTSPPSATPSEPLPPPLDRPVRYPAAAAAARARGESSPDVEVSDTQEEDGDEKKRRRRRHRRARSED